MAAEALARVDLPLEADLAEHLELDPADLLLEADLAEHLEPDLVVRVVPVARRLQAGVEDLVDPAEAAVVRPRTRSSILRMARSRIPRKLARNPTI